MLAGKRDTDYGDKEEQAKQDMRKGNPDTAENKPYDIQQNRKTAIAARSVYGHPAKRPQNECGKLEALQAKRNTYDGATKHKAANNVSQCGYQPAKHQPDKIAKGIHLRDY
jgi:hypothetical protein